MPTLYQRFHFADDQRRDIESFIIQTVSLRRWSTARYWALHYIDGFTSQMINGKISDLYYIKNIQTDCDIHMKKAVLYIETIT